MLWWLCLLHTNRSESLAKTAIHLLYCTVSLILITESDKSVALADSIVILYNWKMKEYKQSSSQGNMHFRTHSEINNTVNQLDLWITAKLYFTDSSQGPFHLGKCFSSSTHNNHNIYIKSQTNWSKNCLDSKYPSDICTPYSRLQGIHTTVGVNKKFTLHHC